MAESKALIEDIQVGKKVDDKFYQSLAEEVYNFITGDDVYAINFDGSWTRSVQEEDDGLVGYFGVIVKADREAFANSWLSDYNGLFTPEDFQEKLVDKLDHYDYAALSLAKESCVVQNPYDNSDHNLMVQLAFTLNDGKDDSEKED